MSWAYLFTCSYNLVYHHQPPLSSVLDLPFCRIYDFFFYLNFRDFHGPLRFVPSLCVEYIAEVEITNKDHSKFGYGSLSSVHMKRSPLFSPALFLFKLRSVHSSWQSHKEPECKVQLIYLLRLLFKTVDVEGLLCQFLFLWLINQLFICFNCKPVSDTNLALSSSWKSCKWTEC